MIESAKGEAVRATPGVARAYIAGAARDGTFSRSHRTMRISQSGVEWLEILQALFATLGRKSWIYRESPRRSVWTIEAVYPFELIPPMQFQDERQAFVRGYFDAEGGIPRRSDARFYIQVCQKDWADLRTLQRVLDGLGIRTGRIHNPSRRVDPGYWRFYVATASHRRFAREVGSWHPRKRPALAARFGPAPR